MNVSKFRTHAVPKGQSLVQCKSVISYFNNRTKPNQKKITITTVSIFHSVTLSSTV